PKIPPPSPPRPSSQPFLRLITRLHDFLILQPLGTGSHGNIYLGQCMRTGELYAIKHVFSSEQTAFESNTLWRFSSRSPQQQQRPPIVQYNCTIYPSTHNIGGYIVMEYCPYGDLLSVLNPHSCHHRYTPSSPSWWWAQQLRTDTRFAIRVYLEVVRAVV